MIVLENVEQTATLAQIIGEVAQPSDNLVLTGDLGAGKTTLTKGIAKGLGIDQMIKSPTYTIIREYEQGRLPLYHMDVYRVEHGAGDLGLDEYFEGDGLSVIEWGNLLAEALPVDYLELVLEKDPQVDHRRVVTLTPFGKQGEQFKQRILEQWTNYE
ncbi:tRNA (adenosine(37)-N6)-threonylcarbamoyltransferase complex ATPase subunit type 1 TsaE [Enterococcus saccharolyticus]|uniref:tRNA threonylcarbamoyladenosine biosynthesis protein TsaE n=1 Tax=Enterococcus saccharolyticus subsp. saccharolyticus ATCC 43076 TaxID=1139996 RepID=S0NGD6_9ENTE|nr:tRNA (adenosine(37)-N6)-threonylcarbamoyltransferase complex ATPase subunit type 1 TsaE [Enterococcus saccharolyticus]EOT29961.1 YjeE family ATPase [Enterococcus saccharolyticus subsp. saccharolyticus ATCC 43076]EOT80507.1 YjeE family ATPase [Enterococcus saccharolyticus subsp. saccharolyticus ATCC 43076]OJG90048.1 YjeE family ATPase [Enterococcus saccharolyticus]